MSEEKNIKFKSQLYRVLLLPISILPMPVLYLLADLFFILILIVGYRRKVITQNLKNSFPEKKNREIRKIRIKFYLHFCDLFVETIALLTMSQKSIKKRVVIKNIEAIQKSIDNGKDVIAVLGHYGNWEWAPTVSLHVENAKGLAVYRPLKSKPFDDFMIKLRSLYDSINIPIKSTARQIVTFKKNNERFILGLISDQSPSKYELNYWTTFLNQHTPIILGPEKMAKLAKADIVYWKMEKLKRGKYQITIIPYPGNVDLDPEFSITEWHVRLLEEQINEKPQYWLWSHKRWKYQTLFNPKTMKSTVYEQ